MKVLIRRNTPSPAVSAPYRFCTNWFDQRYIDLPIYEGERVQVDKNRLLGQILLDGIHPAPIGVPKIEVTFIVDEVSLTFSLFCNNLHIFIYYMYYLIIGWSFECIYSPRKRWCGGQSHHFLLRSSAQRRRNLRISGGRGAESSGRFTPPRVRES